MELRGYIDESCDGDQNLFALSCIVATRKGWSEMERGWRLQLSAVNKKLRRDGRPLISRYHASYCSGRRHEFAGWSHDERDEFVRGLFDVIKRCRGVHVVAYDVGLDDLCEVFPEWAQDRLETAYAVLPKFITYTLGDDCQKMAPGLSAKITLFHDRTGGNGKYDATILRAFDAQMKDPNFPYRHYFTTIAPLEWADSVPLQFADLVAFEWLKEAQARLAARTSRRSFQALMDMDAFGIHARSFTRNILVQLRERMKVDKTPQSNT